MAEETNRHKLGVESAIGKGAVQIRSFHGCFS
jgi:hypothetical protein